MQADASLPVVTLSVTDKYICIYILHTHYTHSYICTIYNTYLANIPWGRNKKWTNIGVTFLLVVRGEGAAMLFNNFHNLADWSTNIFVHADLHTHKQKKTYSKGFSKWFPFYHCHINLLFCLFYFILLFFFFQKNILCYCYSCGT